MLKELGNIRSKFTGSKAVSAYDRCVLPMPVLFPCKRPLNSSCGCVGPCFVCQAQIRVEAGVHLHDWL